jgi:allantoin racemase
MQAHERIAGELGVPFLDPVTFALETAQTWARHGVTQSPTASPPIDRERLEFLLDGNEAVVAERGRR